MSEIETTTCAVCGRVILRKLAADHPWRGETSQQCCRTSALVTYAPGDALLGLSVGTTVEADVYRDGREYDGLMHGSRLVTKRGVVASVTECGSYHDVFIQFDDGDVQVASIAARDGAKRGYPCAAWRVV